MSHISPYRILFLIVVFFQPTLAVDYKLDVRPLHLKPYAKFNLAEINESSGLVKSRNFPGVFWTHNDSGDIPRVFAFSADGNSIIPNNIEEAYSGIHVMGATHIDWEDIAADNKGNLYIGDFGNNDSDRRDLAVYVIKEPDPFKVCKTNVIRKISFFFSEQTEFPAEKNIYDIEAMFFTTGRLFMLSKCRSGNDNTDLYSLDLNDYSSEVALKKIETFDIQGKVTAADATPDGQKIAVLTKNSVWIFERKNESESFFTAPCRWSPIIAGQCEGICFDGDDLLISNEEGQLFQLPISELKKIKD